MKKLSLHVFAVVMFSSALAHGACAYFTGNYVVEAILSDGGLVKVGDKAEIKQSGCFNIDVDGFPMVCDSKTHFDPVTALKYSCSIGESTFSLRFDGGESTMIHLKNKKVIVHSLTGSEKNEQAHILRPE